MALTIEGFTVVAQLERIESLIEQQQVELPNGTSLADGLLWRCSFMAEDDATRFLRQLAQLGLNVDQGPDSDAVLVSEFDESISPYCEWLTIARWEKAVIAWKTGTTPDKVIAREGWSPQVGSGLTFQDQHPPLEFVR